MTAMWKQTALDQAQKKAVVRNLEKVVAEQKKSIQRLKLEAADLKHQRDNLQGAYNIVQKQRDGLEKFEERYEFLRNQELMVMNKDGAQYLKGEDLDKYVDRELLNMPIRYWGSSSMSTKYAQALAQSMIQSKQMVVQAVMQQQYELKTYPMSFTITEDDNGIDP
jgi:predicted nuclease with TOPRIM domain